jgi:hypothetical protein
MANSDSNSLEPRNDTDDPNKICSSLFSFLGYVSCDVQNLPNNKGEVSFNLTSTLVLIAIGIVILGLIFIILLMWNKLRTEHRYSSTNTNLIWLSGGNIHFSHNQFLASELPRSNLTNYGKRREDANGPDFYSATQGMNCEPYLPFRTTYVWCDILFVFWAIHSFAIYWSACNLIPLANSLSPLSRLSISTYVRYDIPAVLSFSIIVRVT